MKSGELRNIAFIFVNDYFIEETGEFIGIRADFLNEFRLKPIDFDTNEIKHGTYLLFAGKKVLCDKIRRNEISEEEVFSGGEKRMIWLSYSSVRRYDKSVWMRLRVTNIPECPMKNIFANKQQRVLCSISPDALDKIIRINKPKRVYVLSNLMSGLVPIIFVNELRRYTGLSVDKLFLGFANRYRSIVVYPFRCKNVRRTRTNRLLTK